LAVVKRSSNPLRFVTKSCTDVANRARKCGALCGVGILILHKYGFDGAAASVDPQAVLRNGLAGAARLKRDVADNLCERTNAGPNSQPLMIVL